MIRFSLMTSRATRHAIRDQSIAWQRGRSSILSAVFVNHSGRRHVTGGSSKLSTGPYGSPLQDSPTHTTVTRNSSLEYAREMPQAGKLQISEGEDHNIILRDLEILEERGWTREKDGAGLRKVFKFAAWMKGVSFVARVGLESQAANHHPMIILQYHDVVVKWSTHRPYGLSSKDIRMAMCSDEIADLTKVSNASIGFDKSPPLGELHGNQEVFHDPHEQTRT